MTELEAEQVVIWYQNLEAQLKGFLTTVPMSSGNHDVYLPLLAPLMVEAGSLIDTVFRKEFSGHQTSQRRLGVENFAPYFEEHYRLSEVKSLLFQHPPQYLAPFDGWTSFKTGNYVEKKW